MCGRGGIGIRNGLKIHRLFTMRVQVPLPTLTFIYFWNVGQLGSPLVLGTRRCRFESCRSNFWCVGQVVKTLPFHGSNMGSIPIHTMKLYMGAVILHI